MDKYFLTIAIPTYNRSKVLERNLKHLFGIIKSDVCIYVSDNNSSDNTPSIISQFRSCANFLYNRNEKNIGFDGNVLFLLSSCQSEYIWFLSDDDFIESHFFSELYYYLKNNKPDCALLNAKVYDRLSGKVLIESLGSCASNKEVNFSDDIFIENIQWSTLISSILLKKSAVTKTDLMPYLGSCFIQLPLFWNSAFNRKIHFLGNIYVNKYDYEKPNFNLSNVEIWFNSWILINHSFKDVLSQDVIRKSTTRLYTHSKFNTSGILVYALLSRELDLIKSSDFNYFNYNLSLTVFEKFIFRIILVLPPGFITLSLKLYRIVKKTIKSIEL